jgi:hypothetical protein
VVVAVVVTVVVEIYSIGVDFVAVDDDNDVHIVAVVAAAVVVFVLLVLLLLLLLLLFMLLLPLFKRHLGLGHRKRFKEFNEASDKSGQQTRTCPLAANSLPTNKTDKHYFSSVPLL